MSVFLIKYVFAYFGDTIRLGSRHGNYRGKHCLSDQINFCSEILIKLFVVQTLLELTSDILYLNLLTEGVTYYKEFKIVICMWEGVEF